MQKEIPLVRPVRDLRFSPLKVLREQKGLSQKQLADKIGMERTRLVRLERKPWNEVCLGDLEIISGALGMRIHELLGKFNGFGREVISNRTQLGSPHFKIESGKGYRFGSVLEKPDSCFIGTLHLEPHKALPADESPKALFLYYLVMEGDLLVTLSGREYLIRERESFTLDGTRTYEFYNPHQFKEIILLVFSLPSFIRNV